MCGLKPQAVSGAIHLRRGKKQGFLIEYYAILWNAILAFRHKNKTKKEKTLEAVWMEKEHKTSYKAVNGFHLLMLRLVSIAY